MDVSGLAATLEVFGPTSIARRRRGPRAVTGELVRSITVSRGQNPSWARGMNLVAYPGSMLARRRTKSRRPQDGTGGFQFVAVEGYLDYRVSENRGRPRVEFIWEGSDDGEHTSGRGSAEIENDTTLRGHIYFHLGDDSGFVAVRPEGRL
jgi:hypothetical protein